MVVLRIYKKLSWHKTITQKEAIMLNNSTNKTQVFSTYDTIYDTWNVMSMDNDCLFFGTIDGLEEWMVQNAEHYYECEQGA